MGWAEEREGNMGKRNGTERNGTERNGTKGKETKRKGSVTRRYENGKSG